ncbi:VPLPA-CTERM sorting domain-containing protein [Sulfurirhabdus autotrophica]|uniref:Putative secreted protein n=1 Tax=Sulfurirhabdus autotrophica TaxID=1706046 RepID=A0A4R3Y170_9PROT|nr:VPLPA-CTERM sorting domain-containing protein [Sulfurirhabdus autotrophica]TCV85172.1 putative secreted protein [Sulfurirhabdus autotrophica]
MNTRTYFTSNLFVFSLIASANASAIGVLATNALPTEIQSCFTSGSCTAAFQTASDTFFQNTYDSTNISAYQYKEGTIDKWLVRYNAFAPSHSAGDSYDSFTNTYNSYNTALTGSLWLSANQSYDLTSSSHSFSLYFDKLSPSLTFAGGFTSAHFNLNSADLLSGGGYSQITNYGNTIQGSLISGPGPDGLFGMNYWSCIECDSTVQFNLAMLKYASTGGLAQLFFNPADPQALAFKFNEYHPDFGSGSSTSEVALYVQPVPLPASLWLLASGLIGLRGFMKRKTA